MNEPSVERPIAQLRETATRIAPAREPAVLMDEVLAATTDPFFAAESPLGTVYVAAGPGGVRYPGPAPSREQFARPHPARFGRVVSPPRGGEGAGLPGEVA